jgi:hypothetical protein
LPVGKKKLIKIKISKPTTSYSEELWVMKPKLHEEGTWVIKPGFYGDKT